jgi:hypothetical protein
MSAVLERPQSRSQLPTTRAPARDRRHRHWAWLAGALPFAFLLPFVLVDVLGVQRDVFYGLYALAVAGFVAGWVRDTRLDSRELLARNWRWGLALGLATAAVMAFIVLGTEDATPRPGGLELIGAVAWRGVLYGVTDGVLLSVFPILAVFAAFAGTRLRRRLLGTALVGVIALAASMAVTATYHLGYQDFRGEKLRKPVAGDVVWSAPTLLTLSPLGAPVAHAGLHVSAVLHSYETDTFLPPHASAGGG